jgi:glycosyltransferase involved in cell wall biosynthesis
MSNHQAQNINPYLSIITCIHKTNEDFIRRSLASIESQTYKDFEHVINIGRVEKSTVKLLRDYKARNQASYSIRFIKTPVRGVAKALNSSFPYARGEVIHFLHADDYYTRPDALQRATAYFRANAEVVWLTGDPIFQYRALKLRLPTTKILKLNPSKVLSQMIFISHENTFMKTRLLRHYAGFDEGVNGPVEYRLWLRMIRQEKILIVDDSFTTLGIHPESTSRGTPRAIVRSIKECRQVAARERANLHSVQVTA